MGGAEQWTALAITLLLEIPIVVVLTRRLKEEASAARTAVVALAATCLTHPLVWFMVLKVLTMWPFDARVAVMEVFAVLAEAVVYRLFLDLSIKHAFGISLFANGVSFGVGLLL